MSPVAAQRSLAPSASRRRPVVVDIADLKVCQGPEDTLITYALGSCVAVVIYDPVQRVGGMLHYMLPLSRVSPIKAKSKPTMFADLGIPMLFHKMYELGCNKKDLVVTVAGGASLYDDKGAFNIGQRNITIMRKMLWKNGVLIKAEDLGGHVSRTVRLLLASGEVWVKSQGEETQL